MNVDRFQILKKFLKALPAAIPHIGDVYSEYFNAKDMDELKEAVEMLGLTNASKLDEIAAAIGAQRERLELLVKMVVTDLDRARKQENARHRGFGNLHQSLTAKTNIRVEQHAQVIQNISGDLNISTMGGQQDGRRNRSERRR